jgi:hypothetical protein
LKKILLVKSLVLTGLFGVSNTPILADENSGIFIGVELGYVTQCDRL